MEAWKRRRQKAHCFWCGVQHGHNGKNSYLTKDHLLPSWARRIMTPDHVRQSAGFLVKKWCCIRCNLEKGPLPPAEFAKYRLERRVLKMQEVRWLIMAGRASRHHEFSSIDELKPFLDEIMTAMLEPFEHRGVAYTPEASSKVQSWAVDQHVFMKRSKKSAGLSVPWWA